jgi:type IV pilus assembly protein PilM
VSRSRQILTLDIGSSKLVMAEFAAERGKCPQLLRYGIVPLEVESTGAADTSAYVVAAIRDLMRVHGFRPGPVHMSISGQMVFPRYVKLPNVTKAKDKLLQMIRYEAEQNVPFPIDEVVWDYQLIDGDMPDETHVMLVAVKTENVARLTDCVEAAGLEPEVVDAAPMALYNVARYNYPDLGGCKMVLDIGARSSNLIFIEGRRVFSRSIPVAGNTITQELMKEFDVSFAEAQALKIEHAFVAFGGVYAGPESEVADRVSKIVRGVVTRLHAEVNRSINFYRSQQAGSNPQSVLLAGGGAAVPHTDTFFREKLKVPVERLNPFASIPVTPTISSDDIQRDRHLLGEVAGLALRASLSCPMEISLMLPEIAARRAMRRRLPFFAIAAAGVMLTILSWWFFAGMQAGAYQRLSDLVQGQSNRLSQQDVSLQKVVQQRKRAMQEAEVLFNLVKARGYWSRLVADVNASLLDGMWITHFKPVSQDGLAITHIELSGRGFLDKMGGRSLTPVEMQYLPKLVGVGGNRSASDVLASTELLGIRLLSLDRFAKVEIKGQFEDVCTRSFSLRAELREPIRTR